MRVTRLVVGAVGVAGVVWGAWLLSDDGAERLGSATLWLAGVVVLHDAVLAPVVVLLGVLAARWLPGRHRAVAAIAFLVWGTLTLTVANVLTGVGGKPGMESLLNRPYMSAWLVLTGAIVAGAIAVSAITAGGGRQDDR